MTPPILYDSSDSETDTKKIEPSPRGENYNISPR